MKCRFFFWGLDVSHSIIVVHWSSTHAQGHYISETLRKHIVLLFLNHLSIVDWLSFKTTSWVKSTKLCYYGFLQEIPEFLTVALTVLYNNSPKHHFKQVIFFIISFGLLLVCV